MKRTIILLISFLIYYNALADSDLDSLFALLEQTMSEREQYDNAKELEIKNIKDLLKEKHLSKEQIYRINNRIIGEYAAYTFDSALHYMEKNVVLATELDNDTLLNAARLKISAILSSSGRYLEAVEILEKIKTNKLTSDLLKDYYKNYRQVYSELCYYTLVGENLKKYTRLYHQYTDSVMLFLDKDTEEYLVILEKEYRDKGQLDECYKINSKRLNMTIMGTRTYALVTYERSLLYAMEQKTDLEKKYLILSAVSDIKTSTKDNASLTELAVILYREKKIDQAYDYIRFSFEDVVFFNSRLRSIVISSILPLITEAYQVKTDKQKKDLYFYLTVISFLTIVLFVALFYIYRQMKKLSEARKNLQAANQQLSLLNEDLRSVNNRLNELNEELSESNHVKEQYIGSFLGICSNYIDKLDVYRKMVKKHIVANQVNELFERTRSRQLIEDELKEFYENFDNTFLNIYPDFVTDFNALLADNEQIILKNGESLNTELRIFALIRLGITDSATIAKLLRYSVNTIYNYRAKIKNKAAVPRDNFENYIMKIGAYSE